MPSPEKLDRPLSDDEWQTLAVALREPGGPNISSAGGFLTAVLTAPTMVPPRVWLPMVMGDRDITNEEEDVLLGLVLRMYNTLSSSLASDKVLCPPPNATEKIDDWCIGYMRGVALDHTWLEDIDAMEPVFPIAVLAGVQPLNHPDSERQFDDEEEWKRTARARLPDLVREAHQIIASSRRRTAPKAGGWARDKPKVGRNEPCPCGSGKKHKKCCGR